MDYATQSSRVGARVPYSMLRGTAVSGYILPLRGGVTWLCQLVCPWHLSSYLVGNYSPPTTVATCNPVLVILPSVVGTAVQLIRYPTYPVILCTLLK